MGVLGKRRSWSEVDACLDDFANGVAEIAAREFGTPDLRFLRLCPVQRQTGSDEQRRNDDSSRSHVGILSSFQMRMW